MVERRHRAQSGKEDPLLSEIAADDAFLTALAKGQQPKHGADPLADVMLALRSDVHRSMPEAPVLAGGAERDELAARRSVRPARVRPGHLALGLRYGLLGAAAAMIVIAGAGITVYNAGEDSPLYGLSAKVFGDRQAMVELAGTLDQADSRVDDGDLDGAMELLDRARGIVSTIDRREASTSETSTNVPASSSEKARSTAASEPGGAEPTSEVPRVTETVTVTETPDPITVTEQAPDNPVDSEEVTPEEDGNTPVPYFLDRDALMPDTAAKEATKEDRSVQNSKAAVSGASAAVDGAAELGRTVGASLEH